MTGLSFIALFVVITVSLCPFMMSEAQRLGPSATNTLNNPFGGAYESPPQIVMTYNNTEHLGVLDSYIFKVSETLGEIPIFNDTIISTIPNQTITIENGSVIRFAIRGNAPPEAQSDALAVNAYTIEGKPVKVLKVADESQKTSFVVDLNERTEYILMAYSYKVNVTSEV